MRSASLRARARENRGGYSPDSIDGRRRSAWAASGVEARTSKAATCDRPSRFASTSASPSAPMTPNSVLLATSFAAEPAPTGPTCRGEPSVESSGVHRSTSAGSPPTKILSEPDSASATLPSTGASSSPEPAASAEPSREPASTPTVVIRPILPATSSRKQLRLRLTGRVSAKEVLPPHHLREKRHGEHVGSDGELGAMGGNGRDLSLHIRRDVDHGGGFPHRLSLDVIDRPNLLARDGRAPGGERRAP